jgi:hypothetical protein
MDVDAQQGCKLLHAAECLLFAGVGIFHDSRQASISLMIDPDDVAAWLGHNRPLRLAQFAL